MSATIPAKPSAEPQTAAPSPPPVPKRITNAQTVCNERNEKGKACWGHLKQLRTAGEPAESHLRGDDVLYKCHRCGTLYMGPPLGHVRDPGKQRRFVEAELSAVLQAAGGTLPVIKKNEKGVYVLVEPGEQGHAPAVAKPAAKAEAPPPTVAPKPAEAKAPTATPKATEAAPAGPKPAAQANRELNRRTTYAGVVDTGPVAGETREQKIERLQKVVAGAKQRAEEGGAEPAGATAAAESAPTAQPAAETPTATAAPVVEVEIPKAAPEPPTTSHTTSGQPDRTLMKRSTYAGVVDTGPIPGETHAQKIERLTKLAAAAKQKAEEGG
jgi:hypothetical protein